MICNDINLIILLSLGIGASLYSWCNQHNVMYLPVYSPWFDTSQITNKSRGRPSQKWVEFRILIVRLICIWVDCCFCSDGIIITWSDKKMERFKKLMYIHGYSVHCFYDNYDLKFGFLTIAFSMEGFLTGLQWLTLNRAGSREFLHPFHQGVQFLLSLNFQYFWIEVHLSNIVIYPTW